MLMRMLTCPILLPILLSKVHNIDPKPATQHVLSNGHKPWGRKCYEYKYTPTVDKTDHIPYSPKHLKLHYFDRIHICKTVWDCG